MFSLGNSFMVWLQLVLIYLEGSSWWMMLAVIVCGVQGSKSGGLFVL